MAAELERRFSLPVQLVKGTGGVLEVRLDDELVFSKKALGRFPLAGEVESAIEARLAD